MLLMLSYISYLVSTINQETLNQYQQYEVVVDQ